jgi:oxygen-dependent protoporphyrinogen oxidase
MEVLPETVAARLPTGSVRTGCRMVGLEPAPGGWRVAWGTPAESGVIEAHHVVLAVPAAAAAALIDPLSPDAAGELRAIAYAPIVSAGMGYDRKRVGHPLDGFGFLVPRREGVRILGGLFSSTLFPGRAPAGSVLITAFIGGAMDGDVVALDDGAVTRCLCDDLARSLGAAGDPDLVRLTRWERAIPQYTLGHLERIARVDGLLEAHSGLHLRANWRDGISVADCIRNSEKLVARIA